MILFPRLHASCRFAAALLLLTLPSALSAAEPSNNILSKGEAWYATDFEATDALAGWSGVAKLERGPASAASACLAADTATGAVITRSLPVERVRGCVVRVSAMVRAESVSAKPNPWNGIKCMLVLKSPDGTVYPQAPIEIGTFAWRRAGFTARVPRDTVEATLVLGLEQVHGKVWFDDIKLTVVKEPTPLLAAPASGPMFKGHSLPRLRGAMISPSIDADSLRVLGSEWKANLVRWQLIRLARESAGPEDYDGWLKRELDRLDAGLSLCEKQGLQVVVDLHSPPGGKASAGGYYASDNRLFTDRACQDKLVEIWEQIAKRFRNSKAIWGYDLVNEPVDDDVAEGCEDWQGLAERVARAIRSIDPDRAIIVEPAQWGSPDGLKEFVPLSVSNVVYSVHMYVPFAFTHQGVFNKGPAYVYPGQIEGKHWSKQQLEQALAPAIDFQKRYNVQIYIGEFSAIRWAPEQSAYRYLRDLIDIFEAHGWDWSYHAFREWSGWSVEHSEDKDITAPTKTPTQRQQLLMEWFGKNQKRSEQ